MRVLTKRPYVGPTDLQPIADLLNACSDFDQLEGYTTASELGQDLNDPSLDVDQDVRLWEDSTGTLIGFGSVWIPEQPCDPIDGYLWFAVHPASRGGQLEAEILNWGESRLRQVGRDRQSSVQIRASSRSTLGDRIAFLEKSGFQQDRCFYTMVRSLAEPVQVSPLPDGFTIRASWGIEEAGAWVEMFNQSFIDHWNYHPVTVERHIHWLKNPEYQAELDLVAIAPDGTLAAFCYAAIDQEANRHKQRLDGWINLLGTRRGFRRLGLGRAMLLSGLEKLQQKGMDTAKLGVDSENPNQALALYQSVGFRRLHTNLSFIKDLA